MKNLRWPRIGVAFICCGAAFFITALLAVRAQDSGTIDGCYQQPNGQFRVVSSPGQCGPSEHEISWASGKASALSLHYRRTTYQITPPNSSEPIVEVSEAPAPNQKYHRIHGQISSIDATARTFTVKHGNDTSTFETDSSTKFEGGGKDIGFADLRVGDDVRVSYTEKGSEKTAARVDVDHGTK